MISQQTRPHWHPPVKGIDIGFDLERVQETGERYIEGLWFFDIRQVCGTGNNGPFRAGNTILINPIRAGGVGASISPAMTIVGT